VKGSDPTKLKYKLPISSSRMISREIRLSTLLSTLSTLLTLIEYLVGCFTMDSKTQPQPQPQQVATQQVTSKTPRQKRTPKRSLLAWPLLRKKQACEEQEKALKKAISRAEKEKKRPEKLKKKPKS